MKRLAIATCLVTLSIAQTVLAQAPSSTPAGSSIQVFHYSAGKATKRWSYMRTKDPDAIDLLHAPPEASRAQ